MKPTDLRGILQYIPRFREKIFVISVDGAVVADENFANLLTDVAVLRSLNIKVTLVHGAAEQIRRLAADQGVTPSDEEGGGVTDAPTLRLALTAANHVTHRLLEGLASQDLRAACPNAIVAHPVGILRGVDQQFTGKVERVDTALLNTLLDQGILPVLPPLGFDGEGHTYRVNSDAIATAVAARLGAVKLLFVTGSDGLRADGGLLRQVLVTDLERMLREQPERLDPATLSKARHAVRAANHGVPRIHVINGRVDEALLTEVFSNEGIGTLIHASEYREIRRAQPRDVPEILKLIRPAIEEEELAERTREALERELDDFFIYEIDGNPVACVALHAYPEAGLAEVACLCVKPAHENRGIARKLLQFLETTAREAGVAALFALSTQAFTWFQQKGGFVEATPDALPPGRRARYQASGRNSKILLKPLS